MPKLRIGLIGAGSIATHRHIPAYLKLKDRVTLTALSDIDHKRAEEIAETFGIPKVYQDYREMFAEVDAVTICTPNACHAEMTIAALQAGIHVLCEKPMAITTAEGRMMLEAAKKANKVLSVGYHYRFMKEAVAAKRIMSNDEIGKPLVIRAQALRRRKVPGWGVFTHKRWQGGGCLIDYGSHLLDLAQWLMGNPQPLEIIGSTYDALSKTPGQINEWGAIDHSAFDVEDHAAGFVKFDNGATLLFEASWSANIQKDEERLSISGDRGGLEVFPFQLYQAKHGLLFNSEAVWIPGESDPGLRQAENFVSACLGEADLVVKPEEAMRVTQLIEAIYQSSESGKSITIQGEGITH